MIVQLQQPVKSYPEGFYKMDYMFTPSVAARIILSLPNDTYHWPDLDRKRPGKDKEYAELLRTGSWQPQLLSNGRDNGHPIRFNKDNVLTHGFTRLVAVLLADIPMPAIVVFPPGGEWAKLFLGDDT